MSESFNLLVVQRDQNSPLVPQLSGAGYHVQTVTSVVAAIATCFQQRFDLVLSETELDDGTGEEVARQADRWTTPSMIVRGGDDQLLERVKKALEQAAIRSVLHS